MQTQSETTAIRAIKFDGYKIELSTNIKGKPVARLFKYLTVGKNKDTYKLIQGYYFQDEQRRQDWVTEQMNNIKKRIAETNKAKESVKTGIAEHQYKIGDILYQSWGYEQTNVDFFEIVEVLPKSVKIRAIYQKMVENSQGFMSEYVTPVSGKYKSEAVTKPVKAYISCNGVVSLYIPNGRHILSLYKYGEKGLYQSHYA